MPSPFEYGNWPLPIMVLVLFCGIKLVDGVKKLKKTTNNMHKLGFLRRTSLLNMIKDSELTHGS